MSKCKFKVGDYVVGNSNNYYWSNKGWVGKVVRLDDNGKFTAEGKWGSLNVRCIALDPKDFDLYTKDQPTKIVITTDGKTTTAKMYRDKTLVKVETAECHPHDRFDFNVGAKIAFDRLIGAKEEEAEIKVGDKVKVINSGLSYTTYTDWVVRNIEDKRVVFRFDFDKVPNSLDTYEVVEIKPHGVGINKNHILAYIWDMETDRCYLIDVKGLERVSK